MLPFRRLTGWAERHPRAAAGALAAAAFAAAFAVRLPLALERDLTPVADESSYLNGAANVAAGRGFIFQPNAEVYHFYLAPAYVAFVAPFLRLLGGAGLRTALVAQALAGAAAAPLVVAVGRRWGGALGALVVAAAYAFHPYLIYYSSRFLTEALAVPLFAAFLFFYARDDAGPGCLAAAAGMLGLATLTRPIFVYVAVIAGVCYLLRGRGARRRRARDLAVAAAVFTAVVLPWTVRNWRLSGRFILVTDVTGAVLYHHNAKLDEEPRPTLLLGMKDSAGWRAYRATVPADDVSQELAYQDYLTREALAVITTHKAAFIKACAARVAHTFALAPAVADWAPGASTLKRAAPYCFAFSALLYLFAGWGLCAAPRASPRLFFLATIVAVTLVHAATVSLLRYRLPTDVLLVCAAGWGAAAAGSFLARAGRRRP